jgi:hypothetical protein
VLQAVLAIGFLSLGHAASADLRVGVAAIDGARHCLALVGDALETGAPVVLIAIDEPQRLYRAVVVRPLRECAILNSRDTPGPYYAIGPETASGPEPPNLAVAIVGHPDARVVGGQVWLRLSDAVPHAQVRRCASSEGLHLTVWSGTPLKSVRLWHAYWYLGFDVEPDCRPADYGERD